MLSLLYLFLGYKMLAALLMAALIHELGHVAALKLLGADILHIGFDVGGMCMSCAGLENRLCEFIALLSGPLFGGIFAFLCSYYGNMLNSEFLLTVSGFSFILTVYNLLPILPLDGGRMLKCLLTKILGVRGADRFCALSSTFLSALLGLLGGMQLKNEWGRAICFAGIILLISQMNDEGYCKIPDFDVKCSHQMNGAHNGQKTGTNSAESAETRKIHGR